MKRFILTLMIIITMLTFTACKDKNSEQSKKPTAAPTQADTSPTLTPPEKEQEIIENYKPAGEIYGEEAIKGYNVTPEYSFDFDEYDRYEVIYYKYNGDDYIHTYNYYDEAETLLIYTFCNDVLANEKEFSYNDLKNIESKKIVDGYFVTNPKAE